jgi:hypothetical protein
MSNIQITNVEVRTEQTQIVKEQKLQTSSVALWAIEDSAQFKKMCSSIIGANLRAFDENYGFFKVLKIDKSLLYKEIKFFQIF